MSITFNELKYNDILANSCNIIANRTVAATDVMLAGTILGQIASTSEYVTYDSAAENGAGMARAILLKDIDKAGVTVAPVLLSGLVRRTSIQGLTSSAESDLIAYGIHMDAEY